MREIKFRAWDKSFEQMVEWEELKFDKDPGDSHICFYEQKDGSDSFWNGGADYITMQYTGLKDKNGTEIYEGDIVRVIHEDGYETVGQVEWGLSSKLFGTYPAFAITELESEMNSFAEIFDSGQYTIEIIGNIYENPELLEEKQ